MDNYPIGVAYDDNAPWNEEDTEISVTISITMSKSVKLKHPKDLNLDSYELKRLVEEQIDLPFEKFKSWYVDDFVVNED